MQNYQKLKETKTIVWEGSKKSQKSNGRFIKKIEFSIQHRFKEKKYLFINFKTLNNILKCEFHCFTNFCFITVYIIRIKSQSEKKENPIKSPRAPPKFEMKVSSS